MIKAVREEKGKVPKSNRNTAKGKSREVLQRRVQLPLGELKKAVRTKAGKAKKIVIDKSSNYGPKKGAVSKFDE